MMKKLVLIILLLPIYSLGQQTPLLSHYYDNLSMINPSMVGFSQNPIVSVNARQQWRGFDSESSIGRSSISVLKGFNNDGFGVQVFNDNSGNLSQSGFKANYSRKVMIDEQTLLYYGLSGGYLNNQIKNISIDDFSFFNNDDNWSPTASFGATIQKNDLLVGVSVDGLLESDRGFTEGENILEKYYYAYLIYDTEVNPKVDLKPSVLYRQAESGSSQFDLNLQFCYNNTLRFGVGYIGNFEKNTNFGPLLTVGLNFNNIRSLFSQEFSANEVASYSGGTNEVTFIYEVNSSSKKPTEKKKEVVEELEEVKIDSDNDGVFDDEDECPNTFGSKSANGCPDIDNDGIRDSQDFCPNTIGEIGNNGCPILSEKDSVILSKAMRNLEFNKNSSEITVSSFSFLTNIGKMMLANKNMILTISGHTDSDASDEYNYLLSAKRAQKVKDFLLGMGIKQSRLVIDFYGELKPIAPNNSDDNMQKNRRVEFSVTFI